MVAVVGAMRATSGCVGVGVTTGTGIVVVSAAAVATMKVEGGVVN